MNRKERKEGAINLKLGVILATLVVSKNLTRNKTNWKIYKIKNCKVEACI